MPVIQITEKNKKEFGGKCVVINSHIHEKQNVQVNQVVVKIGMDYFEAIQAKLVRPFIVGQDEHLENNPEPQKELTDAEVQAAIDKMEVEPSPEGEAKVKSKKSKLKSK